MPTAKQHGDFIFKALLISETDKQRKAKEEIKEQIKKQNQKAKTFFPVKRVKSEQRIH